MVEVSFLFLLTVIGYLALRNHDLKAENERLRKFDTFYDYPSSPIDTHGCKISGKSLQKNITFNAVDKEIEIIADVAVDDKFRLYITNCAYNFHSMFELGDRFEKVTLQIESDYSITFISGFILSIASDRLCIQYDRYVFNYNGIRK